MADKDQAGMNPALISKYSAPVPRYTSYPTTPHFSPSVDHVQYEAWLARMPTGTRLSLYVHMPFCRTLCWYCGCTTKGTRRYEPVSAYLGTLLAEMVNVAAILGRNNPVEHLHWGGGSPNILQPSDIMKLGEALKACFLLSPEAEFAVEIDPRYLTQAQVEAFARIGTNRISFGVQDFDESVQRAINRLQSFETTACAVGMVRDLGVRAINIDLVYGLPYQTLDSLERTIERVVTLRPDRIAVFGYAHLPERLRHQRLIDTTVVPDCHLRFRLATRLAQILEQHAYVRIGLDHFARPEDPLARVKVRRNFQGYTTDVTDALIGVGASAIGRFPQGYVQNATSIGDYTRRVREHGFATSRGFRLGEEDRIRGYVIERLMCELELDGRQLVAAFGESAQPILTEARALLDDIEDGLVERTDDGFRVTPDGSPFLRSICARSDAYLGTIAARHSSGL